MLRVAAVRGEQGLYGYQPPGRAEVMPSLPGAGALAGFAAISGSVGGVAALLVDGECDATARDESRSDASELWVCVWEKWERVRAPWEEGGGAAPP